MCDNIRLAAGRGSGMPAGMQAAAGAASRDGLKLKEKRFRGDIRKEFFTQSLGYPWKCPKPGWTRLLEQHGLVEGGTG